MSVEKLTIWERDWIEKNLGSLSSLVGKMLRIIDQLTDALAAAQASHQQTCGERHVAAARVRELEYANEQRRLVINTLELKLAAANVLLERMTPLVNWAQYGDDLHDRVYSRLSDQQDPK